jgi:hypothetical protein
MAEARQMIAVTIIFSLSNKKSLQQQAGAIGQVGKNHPVLHGRSE